MIVYALIIAITLGLLASPSWVMIHMHHHFTHLTIIVMQAAFPGHWLLNAKHRRL